jgi:hypothetical protein
MPIIYEIGKVRNNQKCKKEDWVRQNPCLITPFIVVILVVGVTYYEVLVADESLVMQIVHSDFSECFFVSTR